MGVKKIIKSKKTGKIIRIIMEKPVQRRKRRRPPHKPRTA